jgi:uncharacterized membrane protein YccF (DUF307 family)
MSASTSGAGPEQVFTFQRERGPGCILQAIWFIFVGWWLGAISIAIAWILNLTIIGLPLGMALLNNIPKVLALQDSSRSIRAVSSREGKTFFTETQLPQINFFLRAIYFLFIGWWWSGIWLGLGYLLAATIILLPVSLQMFRMAPLMTTLKRY